MKSRRLLEEGATTLYKAKRLRTLSFAIGMTSFVGLVTQLLCASMVQDGGIVAKLDLAPKDHHLVLREKPFSSENENADPLRRLVAAGLNNAKPTQAKKALEFYSSLREEDLSGTKVYADEATESQYALVFTFYLENLSPDGDESFSFHIGLHDVASPTNGATHPYSYLRLVVYANVVGKGDHFHTFFAAPNSLGEGTFVGGENDNRECISEYERYQEGDTTLRKPIFHDGTEGYCENFRSSLDSIVSMPLSLGPKEMMRFSLLVYFEGYDPDCIREAPVGASLGLTAYFGEDYA